MLNQVTLIGRLVKKPELRTSESGMEYLKASIAVQSQYKAKEGTAEFIDFTAFGKVAHNTVKYCDKGSMINILGSLSNSTYTDKNGVNHYQLSLIAHQINFLSRYNKKEEIPNPDDVFTLGQ
ncbi:MAG: single-stranded DNA-binding protein [Gemella sp.]|nr:single-stranded DNA-binding protein [Gemella sp.]